MTRFSELLEEFRKVRQMNKKDLAQRAGLTPSYVSQLTRGERTTPSEAVVHAIASALNLDRESRLQLLNVAGFSSLSLNEMSHTPIKEITRREDLSEAPIAQVFYGRQDELVKLKQWVLEEHCQLALVLGLGGIGKTALVAALTNQIKDQFEYVFWRSLINAPALENILQTCIQFISNQNQINLPDSIDDQVTLLIEYLREHRCLLILDNSETILQGGQQAGSYQERYTSYSRLLQRIGEVQHNSCLLLTSREKPRDIALMEGKTSPVRTLHLTGVRQIEGKEILKDKGLAGSDTNWATLIDLYSGNPLALKLVSESIQDVFNGNIDKFLDDNEEEVVFGDINDLIHEQFHRLSVLEQEILYWLAIEREPITLESVREDLTHQISKGIFLEVIASLRRRSMIETRGSTFLTLQPVIMEYTTTDLVKRAYKELTREFDAERGGVWIDFAFMKAQTKDYVRDSQKRLILGAITELLLTTLRREDIEQKFKKMLSALRQVYPQPRSYLAGNILNMLIHLQCDLRGYDFSHLVIRQAYLQNAHLPEVNFAHANLIASTFTNTFGNILSLAFSIDEDRLIAGTATGRICIYNSLTGELLVTCDGHTDGVWSLSFSPNGYIFASSSDDESIRLWDVSNGKCLNTLRGHTGRVRSVTFHPSDENIIASGSDDGTIRIWDITNGKCLKTLEGHTSRVWSVIFNPEGSILASGSTDQTVRLWDINNNHCFRILEGHTGWIRSLAFSPKGHMLVSGSDDGTIRVWDIVIGSCLKTLQGHTNRVWSVAFSPIGPTLASGSEDHSIRIWDVNTGSCLKTLQGHTHGVRSTSFNSNGSTLVSGGDDQTIRLWEVNTGHCLRTLQGYTSRVWSATFSSDGQRLVSGGEDQTIRVWDTRTDQCLKTLQDRNHGVRDVAFSPDGQVLASGGEDHSVRLWDATSGECLKILQGHTNWLRSVAFSPDGQILASGGEDHSIRLWDVHSGECLNVLQGHTSWIRSIVFSLDGRLLASGADDNAIRIWEPHNGLCLHAMHEHIGRIRTVAFHPEGTILASGSEDNSIYLWDTNTGQRFKALKGHKGWVLSVAFSPDGQMLASGSDDHEIRLWDLHTGTCLKILRGHYSRIRRISFHPEGKILASCSDDGTIKFWNVHTSDSFKTLFGERPYERMNITDIKGLTLAQKDTLIALGAIKN